MAIERPRIDTLGIAIVEALGIDKRSVRHVSVDCPANGLPVIYVEIVGDSPLEEIDWADLVQGAEVRLVKA